MQVFLSYALGDRAFAEKVGEHLTSEGLKVWDAARQVVPGENWAARVGEALEASQAMVVVLSDRSPESMSVQGTIEYALAAPRFRGRLIPVVRGRAASVPWILRRFPVVGPSRSAAVTGREVVKLLRRPRSHAKLRPARARRDATPPRNAAAR
jgi:hypothetical protein